MLLLQAIGFLVYLVLEITVWWSVQHPASTFSVVLFLLLCSPVCPSVLILGVAIFSWIYLAAGRSCWLSSGRVRSICQGEVHLCCSYYPFRFCPRHPGHSSTSLSKRTLKSSKSTMRSCLWIFRSPMSNAE